MNTGVWIDAEKAWVMKIKDSDERFLEVDSGLDTELLKKLKGLEVARMGYDSEDIRHDMELRKVLRPLRHYFDRVVDQLRESESIVLEGSAEVKLALLERLHDQGIGRGEGVVIKKSEKGSFLEFRNRIKEYYS